MKFLKYYFAKQLTQDELLSLLISKNFFGEDGEHLMEDGRAVLSRASRDPELRKWIEARKANLLKYATVDGMVPRIKAIIGEYEMLVSFMTSSVRIPGPNPTVSQPEISTLESFKKAWDLTKGKKVS